MRVLGFIASKGGVGKSTLAAAIAVRAVKARQRVGLLDMDPQNSLTHWWRLRGEPDNPRLLPQDYKPKSGGYNLDLIVLDSPPSNFGIIDRAIEACDAVIIPVRVGMFDIVAVADAADAVKEQRKPFAFVLNADEARRRELRETTLSALAKVGPVLSGSISQSPVHVSTLLLGKTGPEAADGLSHTRGKLPTIMLLAGEAAGEINALWKDIQTLLRAR